MPTYQIPNPKSKKGEARLVVVGDQLLAHLLHLDEPAGDRLAEGYEMFGLRSQDAGTCALAKPSDIAFWHHSLLGDYLNHEP